MFFTRFRRRPTNAAPSPLNFSRGHLSRNYSFAIPVSHTVIAYTLHLYIIYNIHTGLAVCHTLHRALLLLHIIILHHEGYASAVHFLGLNYSGSPSIIIYLPDGVTHYDNIAAAVIIILFRRSRSQRIILFCSRKRTSPRA